MYVVLRRRYNLSRQPTDHALLQAPTDNNTRDIPHAFPANEPFPCLLYFAAYVCQAVIHV